MIYRGQDSVERWIITVLTVIGLFFVGLSVWLMLSSCTPVNDTGADPCQAVRDQYGVSDCRQ